MTQADCSETYRRDDCTVYASCIPHARGLLPGPMSRTVAEHPYRVSLYASWADHDGLHVGFQTEAEARAFAASRPEPLIDLTQRLPNGGGLPIAQRRAVPWGAYQPGFVARDDFPR